MRPEDFVVEVRNGDLERVGLIQPELLSLKADLLYNNVGSWQLALPADHRLAPRLREPGAGLIVWGPDDVIFSGPVVMPTYTLSAAAARGMLTIEGVTDEIWLADRLTYPDPSQGNAGLQSKAYDKRSGNAESVIHGYVNANAGPSAPSLRRVPNLIMGTNGNRGPSIKKSARFEQLGAFIADIAQGAKLGFRVVQRGSQLVFETYPVLDRSPYIRLDVWSNSLTSEVVSVAAPTATQVIVGGQGEGENRVFYVGTSDEAQQAQADWGRRIERFVDQRQTDDASEYAAKANEILSKEGLTVVSVKATAADDSRMRFARDWFLGDRVAVMIDTGEVDTVVSGATITVDTAGAKVGVVLGDPDQVNPDMAFISKYKATEKRISQLERTSDPTGAVTGMVRLFRTGGVPGGWLSCNGASISRSTYSALFAVIGTQYGSASSTTFNVPNLSPPGTGVSYAIKT